MDKYHKIQNLYLRDPIDNYKTVLEGQYTLPEFRYLKDIQWVFTEKVDGTNIRIIWSGVNVSFCGRTNRSDIPVHLFRKLKEIFTPDLFLENDLNPCCLYGEGYGTKIQKGGESYISDDCDFILFDVLYKSHWQSRYVIDDIARKLKIKTVPIIGKGTLDDAVMIVKKGFKSHLRNLPPEGLVLRPEMELYTRKGERIIAKLKLKDFDR